MSVQTADERGIVGDVRAAARSSTRLYGKARGSRGQALIEYLLMTVMLLALFTGLYRVLQGQLRFLFQKAGKAILYAYY